MLSYVAWAKLVGRLLGCRELQPCTAINGSAVVVRAISCCSFGHFAKTRPLGLLVNHPVQRTQSADIGLRIMLAISDIAGYCISVNNAVTLSSQVLMTATFQGLDRQMKQVSNFHNSRNRHVTSYYTLGKVSSTASIDQVATVQFASYDGYDALLCY